MRYSLAVLAGAVLLLWGCGKEESGTKAPEKKEAKSREEAPASKALPNEEAPKTPKQEKPIPIKKAPPAREKKKGKGQEDDPERVSLRKSADTTSKTESYAFTRTVEIEGVPVKTRVLKGRYEEGTGLRASYEGFGELIRRGRSVVFKPEGGDWKRIASEISLDANRELRIRNFIGLKAPHEEIAGFVDRLREITPSESKGGEKSFEGPLTRKGVRESLAFEALPRFLRPEKIDGRAKVWVGADGRIRHYRTWIEIRGIHEDRKYEVTFRTTVTFAGIGETSVTIPEEAEKLLKEEEGE